MVQIKNFSAALEKDLERLGTEISTRREQITTPEAERAVVKESLVRVAEGLPVTPMPSPSVAMPVPVASNVIEVLPDYLVKGNQPEAIKLEVERLVGYVFSAGLSKAIDESKRHSPFVQDAFHDSLVDKLMPELKKRGMI